MILQVEEHGLLGLTQQLSNITSGSEPPASASQQFQNPFGSPNKSNNASAPNPFASPNKYQSGSQSNCMDNGSESIESESKTLGNGSVEAPTSLGFDSRLQQASVNDGSIGDSGIRFVVNDAPQPASLHTLPSSWPGTASLLVHVFSYTLICDYL